MANRLVLSSGQASYRSISHTMKQITFQLYNLQKQPEMLKSGNQKPILVLTYPVYTSQGPRET